MRLGKVFWFLVVFPTLVGFDWGTKELARTLPVHGTVPVVNGWLSMTHAENPDVAFSMPVPLALIFGFGVVATAGLFFTLWRLPAGERVQATALSAIAAGAIGNLVDRIGDGSVTDFVHVYTDNPVLAPWLLRSFGTASWPIFNVADVALLAGVALWLVRGAVAREQEPDVPEPA